MKLIFSFKLYIYLLIPIILLVSLYFSLPVIAQYGLNYWLEKQQFSNVILEMEHPYWNRLYIKNIYLEKQTNNQIFTLNSNRIDIKFNPFDLLLRQRFSLIHLPESKIRISFLNAEQKADNPEQAQQFNLKELLPEKLFQLIPAKKIAIDSLSLTIDLPNEELAWKFNGSTRLDNSELSTKIHLTKANQPLGLAVLKLSKENKFSCSLVAEDKTLFSFSGKLYHTTEQLTLESNQRLNFDNISYWQTRLVPSLTNFPAISGFIELDAITHIPIKTKLSLKDLLKTIDSKWNINTQVTALKPIPEIGKIDARLNTEATYSSNQLEFMIAKTSQLSLSNIVSAPLQTPIKQIQLNLLTDAAIQLDATASLTNSIPIPTIEPVKLEFDITKIDMGDINLSAFKINLKLEQPEATVLKLKGKIKSNDLKLFLKKQALPELKIASEFLLENQKAATELQLTSSDIPLQLTGSIVSQFNNPQHRFKWQIKPFPLAKIPTKYLPMPLQINQGKLFHQGKAKLTATGLSAQMTSSVANLNFNWDKLKFQNLSLNSATSILPSGKIKDVGTLSLETAQTGIDIQKLHSFYSFEQSAKRRQLQLKSIQANLLGGILSIEKTIFDPLNPDINTHAIVSRLELGKILELEKQQGLSGKGYISGNIPIKFNNGKLTIENGRLTSLAPGGEINFRPTAAVKAAASTNPGLKIAMDILENFTYQALDVVLIYAADGTANLRTHLKGKNPDWNDGHPVDFSINIEENIPSLMKTLQFTDKLTQQIEQHYR